MTTMTLEAQSTEKRITSLLTAMALQVEEAVDPAIGSLLNSGAQTLPEILRREAAINEIGGAIDRAVFAALEEGELPPEEVRLLTLALKINQDLQHLGGLAADIIRKVDQTEEPGQAQDYSELQPLAIAVSHVCRLTLRALTRQNLVLANNVLHSGAVVDDYRNYAVRGLREQADIPGKREGDMHLMFASRSLEQIADLAVDLAAKLVLFLNEKQGAAPSRPLAS